MGDRTVSDEQLALLLQASRDFALEQMARGDRLIPFATRATADGTVDFTRFERADTDEPLDEIYATMQQNVAKEAAQGDLLAAGLVAAVMLDKPESGFEQAIRVHIEAPGYSRQVLVPYGVDAAAGDDETGSLTLGEMVAYDVQAVLFAG